MIRNLLLLILSCSFGAATAQNFTTLSSELLYDKPPFNNCHASTLIETKDKQLLVACFGGKYEGAKDVVIWAGAINAAGKITPGPVADGVQHDTLRYPCWNPVFYKTRKGELVLFYKVGPNPREWWGMMKRSTDNGRSWSAAQRLPENILGPIKNKAILLKNGTVLCPSSIEEASGHWKAFIEKTDESFRRWTLIPIDTTSSIDVIQPSVLVYEDSRLQVLCRSKQGNVAQSWSDDNGATWSPLTKTALLNPNSGTDAVTLKNGLQLIVYNPDVPGKDWFNGRAKLRVACSVDGEHWKDVATLEDGTTEEFSYPAIIQTQDGLIHITYTYDRKNIKHVVLKQQ
ncbi:exo-alpha-sialidase [Chitinophaga sp. Hz27]|uniref:sialidase family protein n=1 Tax=Chitinophaga sp. Hz27 TaxID=3347169 RepID=UPI0035E1EBFD